MKGHIHLFMLVFLLFSCFSNLSLYAQDDDRKTRQINLVYDDSNSMVKDDSGNYVDTWCQAKYAMEVFAAMLDINDTLHIFAMSDFMDISRSPPKLIIHGSQSVEDRVEKIHSMLTTARGTPYSAVKMAYSDLLNSKADEKWLIVLTDGEFTNTPNNIVNNDFSKFVAKKDIRIIYLAIGDKTSEINKNEEAGIFIDKAATAEQILGKLTNICNRIFQRNILEFKNTAKYQFSFDLPMRELFVFAQGPNVELKGLIGENANYLPGSKVQVSFSEKAALNHLNDPGVLVNKNLTGTVSTFNNIPKGTYSLDVRGATTVGIYYKPDVKIGLKIFTGDIEVTDKGKLVGGDYRVEFGFIDENNTFFKSDLLGQVEYSASMYNNGTLVQSNISSGSVIPLVQGNTKIDVTANFLGYNKVDASLRYRILKPAIPLDISIAKAPQKFSLSALSNETEGILVTIMQAGKLLDKDQWEAMGLPLVSTDAKIDFFMRKGKEISTFNLVPAWKDGDKFLTATGEISATVKAEMLYDEQLSKGSGTQSIKIIDDISSFERFKYWYRKYGTLALAILSLLLIIIGYLPPFKKYLPRRLNRRPVIRETAADFSSMRGPSIHYGKCRIHPASTFIPYVPQSADISFLPRGTNRGFTNVLIVKALGGGRMLLKNTKDFAGKTNLKFNGDSLPNKESKAKIISLSTTISTITDGRRYECSLRK